MSAKQVHGAGTGAVAWAGAGALAHPPPPRPRPRSPPLLEVRLHLRRPLTFTALPTAPQLTPLGHRSMIIFASPCPRSLSPIPIPIPLPRPIPLPPHWVIL